jgi:hypothetical protein
MLRSTCLFLFLIFIAIKTYGQGCEGYFPMNKDAMIEMTSYNEKGKAHSVNTILIKDAEKIDGGIKLLIRSDIVDDKGKPVASSDYDAKCVNGSFLLNMKSMLTSQQLEAWKDMTVSMEADDIEYPIEYIVGQKLKDAHLKVTVSMSGMNMPGTTIDITNRVVAGNEPVQTPIGSFDCLKITSNIKVKSIVAVEMKSIEWVSKGNGVIRTESYKGDKLKGYTLLTKLAK